jgi:hypothetical protein
MKCDYSSRDSYNGRGYVEDDTDERVIKLRIIAAAVKPNATCCKSHRNVHQVFGIGYFSLEQENLIRKKNMRFPSPLTITKPKKLNLQEI